MNPFSRALWLLVRLYQLTLSHLIGRTCRHYPTCSHYALWQLEKNGFLRATGAIVSRVLRCNPLFGGGIEYPRLKTLPAKAVWAQGAVKIAWWYIPDKNGGFFLIKGLKERA